jgi:restriction system protein
VTDQTQYGMAALVAAWNRIRANRRTAGIAASVSDSISVEEHVRVIIGSGALKTEGQDPGVEEEQLGKVPELLIPASIVLPAGQVDEGQLIEAVAWPWFEIIKKLEQDPQFLHKLDWRTLEELIAGAYRREGWDEVILTPPSGDKGRDVIASKRGVGAIRFYDQVKKYAPGHKVVANDVRALVGVLTVDPNVSKAVITTTASFAPGVYDEMKNLIPYRLELKDGPKLNEWLIGLGSK